VNAVSAFFVGVIFVPDVCRIFLSDVVDVEAPIPPKEMIDDIVDSMMFLSEQEARRIHRLFPLIFTSE